MMQLSFRHALRVIVGLILCLNGFLTSEAVETPTADSTSAEYNERYIQHLKKREQRWMKLIPNLSSIQYAGSTGSVALGIGWDYGCGNRWETHVMLGVIPKQHYWHTYWSLTLKEVYTPWTLPVKRRFAVKPLYATLFVNSILHSDFWTSEPDRYPDGYYGFSSRIRFHLGIGQRFSLLIPAEKRRLGRELSLYYEISTCDLYVRQKFLNKSVPFSDMLSIGIGLIYNI